MQDKTWITPDKGFSEDWFMGYKDGYRDQPRLLNPSQKYLSGYSQGLTDALLDNVIKHQKTIQWD